MGEGWGERLLLPEYMESESTGQVAGSGSGTIKGPASPAHLSSMSGHRAPLLMLYITFAQGSPILVPETHGAVVSLATTRM